ncbi:hypothetical protein BGZ63DRAFT_394355 [Mariannaea sp. PMI_226]|nr:hypothetical protein BGZ63DRAFT_394355 [Mariannaea sp. PMI_226]
MPTIMENELLVALLAILLQKMAQHLDAWPKPENQVDLNSNVDEGCYVDRSSFNEVLSGEDVLQFEDCRHPKPEGWGSCFSRSLANLVIRNLDLSTNELRIICSPGALLCCLGR